MKTDDVPFYDLRKAWWGTELEDEYIPNLDIRCK
jgi:hypothetical protein